MKTIWLWIALAAPAAGCGSVDASGPDAPAAIDAGLDAAPSCAWDAPFTAMVPVQGLEIAGWTSGGVRLSPDERTAYFTGYDGTTWDLYQASRAAPAGAFSTPVALGALNSASPDYDAAVSADGLRLWFGSERSGAGRIWVATRASPTAAFGAPAPADTVNDPAGGDGQPFETADGAELWFTSVRAPNLGQADLWVATWDGARFTSPRHPDGLSTAGANWAPMLSFDRLTLYFVDNVGANDFDIYRTHRATIDAPFAPPVRVAELNTTASDFANWLSPDNCRLYVTSGTGNFVATRTP